MEISIVVQKPPFGPVWRWDGYNFCVYLFIFLPEWVHFFFLPERPSCSKILCHSNSVHRQWLISSWLSIFVCWKQLSLNYLYVYKINCKRASEEEILALKVVCQCKTFSIMLSNNGFLPARNINHSFHNKH